MVSGVKQILLKTPHPAARTLPSVMKPPWNCHSLPLNLEFVSHDLLKSDWSTRIQMLAQANYNNLLSTSLIFVFQQQWACWFQHCSVSSAAHQVTHAEWKLLWLHTTLTSPCPHFAIMSKVMHSKPNTQPLWNDCRWKCLGSVRHITWPISFGH